MTPLVIIAAGGHGSEVACYARELEGRGEVELLGFLDDQRSPGPFAGSRVLGPLSELPGLVRKHGALGCITAVGSNETRKKIVNRIEALAVAGLSFATVASPTAWLGHAMEIGAGTCVAAGAILTTGIRIGHHCIVNMNASIAHDCVIGDFCNINPGAVICGNVTVGAGAFIGAGAVVREKITIGGNAVVGAGAVVIRDVPAGAVVVGVPAETIPRKKTVS